MILLYILERRREIDRLDYLLGTWQRRFSALLAPKPASELTYEWALCVVDLQKKIYHLKDLIVLRRKQYKEWQVKKEGPRCLTPRE